MGAAAVAATLAAGGSPVRARYAPESVFMPDTTVKPATATTPGVCSKGGLTWACYAPSDMQQLYNIPSAQHTSDGSGQTIVLIEAFGNQNVQNDLQQFDRAFDLQDAPLQIVGHNGSGDSYCQANFPGDELAGCEADVQSWAQETSIDVEWAHAIAPGAHLALVVAPSDNPPDVVGALELAISKYQGAIISQSFSEDEPDAQSDGSLGISHELYSAAGALGETLVSGSGDWGSGGIDNAFDAGSGANTVEYPASDPDVVAVGGTQADAYDGQFGETPASAPLGAGALKANGSYGSEQAWNECDVICGATGGGTSAIFTNRTVPDVSYDAALFGGVQAVVNGVLGTAAGTSVGAPQWAGILAIADEERAAAHKPPLGFVNPALYSIASSHGSDFHDITDGNNTYLGADVTIDGFNAGPGYDVATGLGTPNAAGLISDLVASGGSQPGGASDANCQNQTLTGVYHNVNVQQNASCTLSGATVLGNVQANNSTTLTVTGGSIAGNLQANNSTSLTVTGGSIAGNLQANNTGSVNVAGVVVNGNFQANNVGPVSHPAPPPPPHSPHPASTPAPTPVPSTLCDSVVFGNAQVQNSTALSPWSVGGSGCSGDPATGQTGDVVGNNLQFDNNAATGNDVSADWVAGNLECNNNGGVTSSQGGSTVAGNSHGQCSSS